MFLCRLGAGIAWVRVFGNFFAAGYENDASNGAGGTKDRAQYDDPDVTPSQPMSSFPYDGGPPPDREHRRRRRR